MWLPIWILVAIFHRPSPAYYVPYRYQQEFKAAQSDARTQERGLWSPNACAARADIYYQNCAEARPPG